MTIRSLWLSADGMGPQSGNAKRLRDFLYCKEKVAKERNLQQCKDCAETSEKPFTLIDYGKAHPSIRKIKT